MDEVAARAARLCTRLILDALQERTGSAAAAADPIPVDPASAWIAHGTLGAHTLTVGVVFVAPPSGEGPWYAAKQALEQRVGGTAKGGFLLWAPSGAELPAREPHRSAFITNVEAMMSRIVPGGHGEVRFPITLYLRKSDEEGGYLTARGGLAPYWSRFTGRVFGHYQLDATELHRPPSGDAYLGTLIDSIALSANALKLDETVSIDADDAWTMQRLHGGQGLTIIGEPPGVELSSGANLRRALRRTMQAIREPMRAQPADARVVAFVGPYASSKDQPVGTALLGMDPALFGGLDLIVLAADGDVTPLLDLTRTPILTAVESTT